MYRAVAALLCGLLTGSVWAGQADLTWTAPTKNTDGSNLTDLTGYGVYRRCNTAAIIQIATVAVPALAYSDKNLPDDGRTCYWSLTAVNSKGDASVRTNEVQKTFPVVQSPPGETTAAYTWTTSATPPAAYAIVQSASTQIDNSTSAAATVTFPNAVAVGNMVVAFIWCSYPSNRYPTAFKSSVGDVGTLWDAPSAIDRIWIATIVPPRSDRAFIFTLSGANIYQRIWAVEIKGASAVDKTTINPAIGAPGTATDALRTAQLTPAFVNEFFVGVGWNISTQAIPNAGSGYTSLFTTQDPASDAGRVEFATLSTALTPTAMTWTPTANVKHMASAVLLKP